MKDLSVQRQIHKNSLMIQYDKCSVDVELFLITLGGVVIDNLRESSMECHLTLVKMGIIRKSTNTKFWKGCGEKGTFLHCWWEYKLVQPLWRIV